MSSRYKEMFHLYVPREGDADSNFGQTLRYASRVIYRFYNDGDIYHAGNSYVNEAMDWLKNNSDYDEVFHVARKIDEYCKEHRSALRSYGYHSSDYEGPVARGYDELMNELADAMEEICRKKEVEDSGGYYYLASTKKSVPKADMCFADNVNKISNGIYDKLGNINKTMKERK